MIYESGSSTIDFPANGTGITGFIYAPNATVSFSKNHSTLTGFVEALDVIIVKNGFDSLVGTGPTVGGQASSIAPTE